VLAPDLERSTAGAIPAPFLETELAVWQSALATGLELPFFLIRSLAARMAERQGGTIVILAPAAPERPDSVTTVLRGGLLTTTRGLANVLPDRVRVAAVRGGSAAARCTSVAFLLGEPAVASGTIVELGT
jgi:NAD(P)-dependent dehydrogenase (short-subunit alcohol dehydrogenase family)